MQNRLSLLLLLLISASPTFAGSPEDGAVALAIDGGVLIVWNQPGEHFTLEIHGKKIIPLAGSEHVLFNVDGAVLQIQTVPVSDFLHDATVTDEIAILQAHRAWETSYIREALN